MYKVLSKSLYLFILIVLNLNLSLTAEASSPVCSEAARTAAPPGPERYDDTDPETGKRTTSEMKSLEVLGGIGRNRYVEAGIVSREGAPVEAFVDAVEMGFEVTHSRTESPGGPPKSQFVIAPGTIDLFRTVLALYSPNLTGRVRTHSENGPSIAKVFQDSSQVKRSNVSPTNLRVRVDLDGLDPRDTETVFRAISVIGQAFLEHGNNGLIELRDYAAYRHTPEDQDPNAGASTEGSRYWDLSGRDSDGRRTP